MAAAARGLSWALRRAVDYALPPRCGACGTVTDGPHRFCVACWQSLHFLGEPCCVRCGFPFDFARDAEEECGACLADRPPFDRLRAAVAYGPVARTVALKLKYARRPGVAETLARFMARHARDLAPDAVIVPVPLHRWRIWRRGYNQSALIAAALARLTGRAAVLDGLRRVKPTPPLRGMGRNARARAMRGAFAVTPEGKACFAGRPVLLVDDVYTSGATARVCAAVLNRAGAARVDIICWARVIRDD
ncbi:ComF family protein [Allosphingosinicella flava]|uniref:ComF family protein n=1 Tax=Allosphingosinicella flava TaxID=2771430 RepID=A0A7T2LN50_9SPHN|nr:ComF family protein [Sphingosinicella flava]QPQ56244.1 ComF family protein [Sphingosinicella flava]